MNGTPSASRSDRQVLVEDLFLEVLGAGRDEDAMAAEDRGNQIGERLAGAGARFGEQHAAVGEDARDGRRHLALAVARLEAGSAARAAAGAKPRADRGVQDAPPDGAATLPGTAGTSGTAPRLRPNAAERAVVVRRRERARDELARSCPSPASRMPRVVTAGVPMRMPLATIGGF